ncbi:50S ribosomal protein L13 [bacterium]|nr:50S ribosomal protein L13 [bacterium]
MKNKITKSFNKINTDRNWVIVDLANKPLGRAATKIAQLLVGKDKPTYTRNADAGAFVIALNASQIKFTGKKMDDKKYYWHTGFPGGIRDTTPKELLKTNPAEILRHAVKGMLPKNKLNRQIIKKLKIYTDDKHNNEAQKPKQIEL